MDVHVVAHGEMLLERAVDLDRVHEQNAVGEEAREDPESGTDLEHDVGR